VKDEEGKVRLLTRLVAMGLLDTASGGSGFLSGFGGELLTRGLATGGFT
jgi:hypothetical protein